MQPAHAQDPDAEEPRGTNAITGPGNTPVTQPATNANKDAPPNTGTLNFVDADIESVIAAVGDYTNTTFIIDPRVKGTVTLVSEKPLTKAQAFQLLTSVLRLRGYTVVDRQRLYQSGAGSGCQVAGRPDTGRCNARRPDRDAGLSFEI